jgi:hypothetical protein
VSSEERSLSNRSDDGQPVDRPSSIGVTFGRPKERTTASGEYAVLRPRQALPRDESLNRYSTDTSAVATATVP